MSARGSVAHYAVHGVRIQWANSQERTDWLPAFLDDYNTRREHSTLGYWPPASSLGGNNLLTINS